jgi:hypothetical protein
MTVVGCLREAVRVARALDSGEPRQTGPGE